MNHAKKLPSGSWRVRVYFYDAGGARHARSFSSTDKKDAEKQAAAFLVSQDRRPASALTFSQAARQYLADRARILSPSTLRAYESYLKNNLDPLLPVRISGFSSAHLQRLVNRLSADHSPKMVRNVTAFVTAVLGSAAPQLRLSVDLPQKQKTPVAIPNDADVKRLLSACKNPALRTAIVLAASLGLRRGEICALTWQDVDLKAGLISITKDMVQDEHCSWIVKAPKTFSGTRTLSIPEGCAAYLRSIRPADPPDGARVCPMCPNTVTADFIKLRNASGVSCRFHDLRHYYASLMLALGVPDKYAMQMMGHATPNMLKTVYQHTREEKQKQIDAQLSSALGKILP